MYMPNLMNDFAFKYVFGADTIESNNALKGLLETFLERKIVSVQLKNPELTKNLEMMKNSKFDILVRFDDSVRVDIEMQVFIDLDELKERLVYYCARLHGEQDLKGKLYSEADKSYVLAFLNGNLFKDDAYYHRVQLYTDEHELFSDTMGLYFVELKKLKDSKTNEQLNSKEQLMYYILNCQNKETNSRIKEMVENNEVIQVIDKRVNEIDDDSWKKLDEDFAALHENERAVKLQRAEEKGEARGIAIGEARGRQETLVDNIRKFSSILSPQQIADTLDLSLDEVENLLKS